MRMPRSRREILRNAVAVLAAAAVSPFARAAGEDDKHYQIEIADFAYKPSRFTLNVGDTVVWLNKDIAPHTATALDGSWDTGTLKRAGHAAVVFKSPGRYDYFCRFHPMMKAQLIVKAPAGQWD